MMSENLHFSKVWKKGHIKFAKSKEAQKYIKKSYIVKHREKRYQKESLKD